jgi:hypothetical protein
LKFEESLISGGLNPHALEKVHELLFLPEKVEFILGFHWKVGWELEKFHFPEDF